MGEKETKIGIVLNSGGIRGVFGHSGFMLALEELGIKVSASAGCSAGAIVGGVVASGTPIKDWAETIKKTKQSEFSNPKTFSNIIFKALFKKGRDITGLSKTDRVTSFISDNLKVKTFEECLYPFTSVALNLGTLEKNYFSSGELATKIMASAALPLIYEPVEIDGEHYSDGASIELSPFEAICCSNNLDVLIVHHISREEITRPHWLELLNKPWPIVNIFHRVIFKDLPWYVTGEPMSFHKCKCGCKAVIIVLETMFPIIKWPETKGGSEIVEMGKKQGLERLEKVLEDIYKDPQVLLKKE